MRRAMVPRTVRPSPLSDAAKNARAPLPPEELVSARHDRVHVEKAKLIKATPLLRSTQSLRNAAREFVATWEDASIDSAWELHGTSTDVGVLVVTDATSRAGIVPVVFGPLPEQPYSVTCVEIAPREYDALVLGSLTLPDGWSVGRRVL